MPSWSASFAHGDELFLNVRGNAGHFDFGILAHETTHAVVHRLFPRQRWPLWLSEGFAELHVRRQHRRAAEPADQRRQHALTFTNLPIDRLTTMARYPEDPIEVASLYKVRKNSSVSS